MLNVMQSIWKFLKVYYSIFFLFAAITDWNTFSETGFQNCYKSAIQSKSQLSTIV